MSSHDVTTTRLMLLSVYQSAVITIDPAVSPSTLRILAQDLLCTKS